MIKMCTGAMRKVLCDPSLYKAGCGVREERGEQEEKGCEGLSWNRNLRLPCYYKIKLKVKKKHNQTKIETVVLVLDSRAPSAVFQSPVAGQRSVSITNFLNPVRAFHFSIFPGMP